MRVTLVLLVFLGLWFVWVFASIKDNMFSVRQMQSKGRRFERGIPLVGHHAMLYLDVLLPFLFSYLFQKYGTQWALINVSFMMVAGMIVSTLMHFTYIEAGKHFPEAATYEGKLTVAGWLHLIYMGLAFTLLGLFYLNTKQPQPFDVWLTTIWMIAHVVVGVHVPLKLLQPSWFPYRGIFDTGTLLPIFGTSVALVGLSLWALR